MLGKSCRASRYVVVCLTVTFTSNMATSVQVWQLVQGYNMWLPHFKLCDCMSYSTLKASGGHLVEINLMHFKLYPLIHKCQETSFDTHAYI